MKALYIGFAVFLGIFAAILIGQWVHGYLLMRRMRLGPGGTEPVARSEIPAEMRLILDEAAPALAALGFAYLGSRRILPTQRNGDPTPSFGDRYLHPASGSYALVQPAELPEPGAAAAVSFETFFADGTQLLTINRREHLFLPLPPAYRLADGYLPDLTAQWELHQRRLAEAPPEVRAESFEDDAALEQREAALRQATYDYWLGTGVVAPAAEGAWRLSRRAAWWLLRRMMQGNRRLAKVPRRRLAEGGAALLAADLRAYRINELALGRGVLQGNGKIAMFGLSALAGILAFGVLVGWEIVPVLVGVLLFHEFGHALAMRLTGYRNLQVLMIPFLGAVAVGRKDDAGPWTKLLVLLAGPLPGLLLAVGCFYALPDQGPQSPLLVQIAVVALILNLFNLLPFTPLDGGQIVETFLFARWPRLRFLFFVGSILALGALGVQMQSQVLPALALLLLVGMRAMRQRMQVAVRVGNQTPDEAPRAIFAAIYQTPALAAASFPIRFRTLRGVLPQVVARPPRLWESLAGLAIYVAVIALPLAALPDRVPAGQILHSLFAPKSRQAPPPRDWDTELAGAHTPEERWQILSAAAAWLENVEEETNNAHRRYQQAMEIAKGFPPDDLRRLDTRIALVRTGPAKEVAAGYGALLPELRTLQGADRERLAEVLEARNWANKDAPATERISELREAIAVREALDDDEEIYLITQDRRDIAGLLFREGDWAAAEAELRRNLEQLSTPDHLEPLAWLLIDTGRADDAEALLDAHPTQPGQRENHSLAEIRAWSRFAQGGAEQARLWLSEQLPALPADNHWQRAMLLLDLIHIEKEPGRRATWVEAAKKEILQQKGGATGIAGYLRANADWVPWERLRTEARLAALAGLGLPQESSCKP